MKSKERELRKPCDKTVSDDEKLGGTRENRVLKLDELQALSGYAMLYQTKWFRERA